MVFFRRFLPIGGSEQQHTEIAIVDERTLRNRFMVLDYGEPKERMFHCSASSKDAAVKLTTAITEMMSGDMNAQIHVLIDKMRKNPAMTLK